MYDVICVIKHWLGSCLTTKKQLKLLDYGLTILPLPRPIVIFKKEEVHKREKIKKFRAPFQKLNMKSFSMKNYLVFAKFFTVFGTEGSIQRGSQLAAGAVTWPTIKPYSKNLVTYWLHYLLQEVGRAHQEQSGDNIMIKVDTQYLTFKIMYWLITLQFYRLCPA